MQENYFAINASAGSGKTYVLVQRLLMICLKYPNQHDAIRHILALTFTNKAANEMKARILDWLKKFASDEFTGNKDLQNIQEIFKDEGLNLSLNELHRRAKKVLDYILHHYSTLNIGTIDRFNSRLVRSFSYELGLAQNFSLEIQSEPFLLEAVDKMLDEIGEKEDISEAFMDFVNYNLDNNERVNLNKAMYNTAKEFIKDIHYEPLKINENFDWDAYEDKKNQLREEISELKNEVLQISETVIQLLREKNLEPEDFSGGKQSSIAKFFFEVQKFYRKERNDFPFPSNESSSIENFAKGSSAKSKNREAEIFEILDFLVSQRELIIRKYILTQKKEKILSALLPLRVNKDIQKKLQEIEVENDLVLLSKFNIMINENLRNEPSLFIYEKVGTQYQHYFFDEFQDTSSLQWQNFIPLRDHNISSENTTFTLVGDPKQSIYRFRGGDSSLMLNIIHQKENVPAKVINLENNWRSSKNIVDFNNRLYQFISEKTNEEHCAIFGKGSQQSAKADFDGRVKVNFIENQKKEQFYEDVTVKMQQDIQQCLDLGFGFSDITILCRGNFDILNYSQLLTNMKVQYNGEETYIKTISEKGLTLDLSSTILALTAFLRWEISPKNNQNMVKMMYHLNQLGRIAIEDFSLEMTEILDKREKHLMEEFIEEKYALKLRQRDVPTLNLYNFIEYYVQEFSVEQKETDFLLNFLEMLYNFSQNAGSTLKDFVNFWDEEGSKMSIQASENVDAIQIMTIHKAKGLEFPVVFLPMENSNKDGKFQNWLDLESEEVLKSVNISGFDSKLETYDNGIKKFNEENTYQNTIDRFCLQYVATTRPVEQLFFYIEKPNKTANHLEIYDFLKDLQPKKEENSEQEIDSFDIYPVNPEILRKQISAAKPPQETLSINSLTERNGKTSTVKIATPSKNYQERNKKVRTGIFIHEILAQIKSEKDLNKVLENYLLEGQITLEEKNDISATISEILKQYSEYFTENQEVINEKDIMITENGITEMYRPDRIVSNGNGYIIIDFKTGEKQEKHLRQTEIYKNVLEKLGKKVIHTEIIYV